MRLAFQDSFWWLVLVTLWLPLRTVLSVLKGLIIVPVGTMGPFLLENNPFQDCEGACGLCLRSRPWRARASPSEVCPGGKFWSHFACGSTLDIVLDCHLQPFYQS